MRRKAVSETVPLIKVVLGNVGLGLTRVVGAVAS